MEGRQPGKANRAWGKGALKFYGDEVAVLKALERLGGEGSLEEVEEASGLDGSAVMRVMLSLAQSGLLELDEREELSARLSDEGEEYAEAGLPERRMLKAVLRGGGEASLEEAGEEAGIPEDAVKMAVGWLNRKRWASPDRAGGKVLLRAPTDKPEGDDERLLEALRGKGWVRVEVLDEPLRAAVEGLERRRLITVSKRIRRTARITRKGLTALERGARPLETHTALTPELIKTGRWRTVRLKEYDVTAAPPVVYPGKKHVYLEFLEEARRVLIGMGFEEAEGPYVETEFWNYDVLFQAQDHPAREIHDSYILKHPTKGTLEDDGLVDRVKAAHENGWITGSTGWGYSWIRDVSRRLILRTQTTAVSMRYLWTHKRPPVKMFCVSQVFRPDVVDARHLGAGFNQCEGIVGDASITFRHLLGFLKAFAGAFGLEGIKFKPGYFPFTEPSVEGFCLHPKLGWMECVGAGMFRPEVLKPLGIDFPVIAWGIGIDRIAMATLGIDDIRLLYAKDLEFLREKPIRWTV